jgi:hypothetical protein
MSRKSGSKAKIAGLFLFAIAMKFSKSLKSRVFALGFSF